jgi:hypothetical protein
MRKRLFGALAIVGATAQLIGCSASPAGPDVTPAFDKGGTQTTGSTSAQEGGTLSAPTDSTATAGGGTSRGGVFIGPGA